MEILHLNMMVTKVKDLTEGMAFAGGGVFFRRSSSWPDGVFDPPRGKGPSWTSSDGQDLSGGAPLAAEAVITKFSLTQALACFRVLDFHPPCSAGVCNGGAVSLAHRHRGQERTSKTRSLFNAL